MSVNAGVKSELCPMWSYVSAAKFVLRMLSEAQMKKKDYVNAMRQELYRSKETPSPARLLAKKVVGVITKSEGGEYDHSPSLPKIESLIQTELEKASVEGYEEGMNDCKADERKRLHNEVEQAKKEAFLEAAKMLTDEAVRLHKRANAEVEPQNSDVLDYRGVEYELLAAKLREKANE